MAHLDQLVATTTVAGIAEPHQSTVASTQRAVGLGPAEAELMIDRGRPARAPAQPDLQPGAEVPTVVVCPAPPCAVVLAVCGEVDSCTSQLLRDRLLEHLRPTCRQLVVDLTEVSFFGAAGLTVLLAVREAAETAGIRMCLVARTHVVLRPLAITGLDDVFDVCADIAHAWTRMGDVAGMTGT